MESKRTIFLYCYQLVTIDWYENKNPPTSKIGGENAARHFILAKWRLPESNWPVTGGKPEQVTKTAPVNIFEKAFL